MSYGVIERSIVELESERFGTRPLAVDRVRIEHAWARLHTEPYDAITCSIIVVLAEQNTGPVHDMLHRLVRRRSLETVSVNGNHEVHIEHTNLVASLVRSLTNPGRRSSGSS